MRQPGIRRAVWAAVAIVLSSGAADAAIYPEIYAFGDSLSDAGNDWIITGGFLPVSPPYSDGRFSNGAVWVQDLSTETHAGALAPSRAGGTDFAYGGAETGKTLVHAPVFYDLPGQLAEFTATIAPPDPKALYTLWIGANDVFDILADTSLTPPQVAEAVDQVVKNEVDFVTAIAALGAKHVLVLNSPDLGTTPAITGEGPAVAAAATALSAAYNARLHLKLTKLAVKLTLDLRIVDIFTQIDGVIADPAQYHFKNVTTPCWTGGYTSVNGTLCSPSLSGQNRYLFWDTIHPTAHAHQLVAKAARVALAPVKAATILGAAPQQ